MHTQAINSNGKNAKNAKAKENLKKGATLAGAAAIGAGVVVSAEALNNMSEEDLTVVTPIEPTPNDPATQPTDEQETQTTEAATAAQTAAEPAAEHPTHTAAPAQHTEPQPQTSHPTPEPQPQGDTENNTVPEPDATDHTASIDINDLPNVDPDLVANNLTENVVMVDPTDNDYANLDIAAVGKVETVDGQVLSAAQFTDAQGETLYMVDVDDDGIYEHVTDETGNVLADVPTTLTVSDTEQILSVNQGETGYLAQNEHDNNELDTDNALDDIVTLG